MLQGAWQRKFLNPLKELINDSRSIGALLIFCAVLSLVLANCTTSYPQFWNTHLSTGLSGFDQPIIFYINEFLMSFFFFLAGMEIRREFLRGEVNSKHALLPVGAALGGMLMPALFYFFFNVSGDFGKGWGIPTATDIAFTLAACNLMGNKVNMPAKIFITALAIIDDLGAIVIITIFYGAHFNIVYFLISVGCIGIFKIAKHADKLAIWVRVAAAITLWFCLLNAGIHPTISGVVLAFFLPPDRLRKYENNLHHPVHFIILPLFVLANTAIAIHDFSVHHFTSSISLGIIVGLCFGKPLGILLAMFAMVKTKIGELPSRTSWRMLIGVAFFAGIGFTMSIFVSMLAFKDEAIQSMAKLSVLTGSVFSFLLGAIWLFFFVKKAKQPIADSALD
jgi:Na+:H+ antiporter, NhaA family